MDALKYVSERGKMIGNEERNIAKKNEHDTQRWRHCRAKRAKNMAEFIFKKNKNYGITFIEDGIAYIFSNEHY